MNASESPSILQTQTISKNDWTLNTSNPGKLEEFQRLFAKQGLNLTATQVDLHEVDADALTVAAHKASQMEENILVEDTSLDIDGVDEAGVNIRWVLDHLEDYQGKKADWRVLLSYRQGDQVYIYQGIVSGTIVAPRGTKGFGFDPYFLPNGKDKTLAEEKLDEVNARALAVEAFIKGQPYAIYPMISNWDGPWQNP